MKILYLTNIPSPYRVDFFNELGKLCELTVLFEKDASAERNEAWKEYQFENFQGIILPGVSIGVDEAINWGVAKYLRDRRYDRIVCTTFASPMGMLAISYMRLHRIPYWLESDGGRAKDGRGFKEKLKKHFITGAQGYFSTAREHDDYYLAYGAEPDRLHRYPFTSLKNADILSVPPAAEEKRKLRTELSIEEEKCVITVGRFSYRNGYGKGFDLICKIAEQLDNTVGVYIIGEKPTEEFVRMKEEKGEALSNLHFVDFMRKKELMRYYRAADLMLFLSRGEAWGLVINEAMACGLPVIATTACVAANELIEDGVNGYLVPADNYELPLEKTEKVLSGEAGDMGGKCLERISAYTIEKMAENHICALSKKTESK